MSTLREAAQQALEALEWHYRQGHSNTLGGFRLKIDEKVLRELRAALAQQDEPRNQCGETCERAKLCATCAQALAQQAEGGGNLPPPLQVEPTGKQPLQVESVAAVAENATTQQRVVETPPSDYRRGYWDGFKIGKREGRIEAEDALAQQDKQDEPVAWRFKPTIGLPWSLSDDGYYISCIRDQRYFVEALYTAPPQRKPQTLDEAMQQPRAMAQAYENGYKAGVAHEREACAKACEHQPHWISCVAAIRARGNT